MADLVNLRRERKRKMREMAGKTAAANRSQYCIPKRERAAAKAKAGVESRWLDARRLDRKNGD